MTNTEILTEVRSLMCQVTTASPIIRERVIDVILECNDLIDLLSLESACREVEGNQS